MQDYNRHKKCLISESKVLKPIKGYEKFYLVKSEPVGFVFSERIPTEQELIEEYSKYERNDYYSPITQKRYHEILDKLEPYRKTNKLLDVGCGIGYFLEEAKHRGWEVYGTEYMDDAIEICEKKGITMFKGKLDSNMFDKESFDVITSFEVIEHINNPIEEVMHIRVLLRKGGVFYFTTPNFNALERFILKDKYNVLAYPEHLSYYTPKTIHYLLKTNGFTKLSMFTTGISLTRLKTSFKGSAPTIFVTENTEDESLRNLTEKNRLFQVLKWLVNKLLIFFGIGNSIKGLFKKV